MVPFGTTRIGRALRFWIELRSGLVTSSPVVASRGRSLGVGVKFSKERPMKSTGHAVRQVTATTLIGAAILLLASLTSAGRAAAGPPAARLRQPVTAYVGSCAAPVVTPIRVATNTALKPITVGTQPAVLAITPNGKTVYAVNEFSGTVTPIRTATNTALKPIKVGRHPI